MISIVGLSKKLLMTVAPAFNDGQGHHHGKPEKKGILLVTFGSSQPGARAAFDRIDKTVRAAFPGVAAGWAYTSQMVRNKRASAGEPMDSPAEALARMADEGITRVAVQPLHILAGLEYHEVVAAAKRFEQMPVGIDRVRTGRPLLGNPSDMADATTAVLHSIPTDRKSEEAVVLMGHGTRHPSNAVYAALMWQLQTVDENVFVGTIGAFPTADVIIDRLKCKGIEKAWLMPLMAMAGNHAKKDMAGPGKDSWRTRFENAGIACETVIKGIAEYDAFVDIWLGHLKTAFSGL